MSLIDRCQDATERDGEEGWKEREREQMIDEREGVIPGPKGKKKKKVFV